MFPDGGGAPRVWLEVEAAHIATQQIAKSSGSDGTPIRANPVIVRETSPHLSGAAGKQNPPLDELCEMFLS